MENQNSTLEHVNPEQEGLENAIGNHPMSLSAMGDGNGASMPPPPLNLGGGDDRPVDPASGPVQRQALVQEEDPIESKGPIQRQGNPDGGEIFGDSSGGGGGSGGGGNSGSGAGNGGDPTGDVAISSTSNFDDDYITSIEDAGGDSTPDPVRASGIENLNPSPKPNPDLQFLGTPIPPTAPSLTLAPFANQSDIVQGVTLLTANESLTKPASEKLVEAESAVVDPDHEGRKNTAKSQLETGADSSLQPADIETTGTEDAIHGEINDQVGDATSHIEFMMQNPEGEKKLGPDIEGYANVAVENYTGEDNPFTGTINIDDSSQSAVVNPATPLPDLEEAIQGDAIEPGQDAWLDPIEENGDFTALKTLLDEKIQNDAEIPTPDLDSGDTALEDVPEYKLLEEETAENSNQEVAAERDIQAAELETSMQTAEQNHHGEMELIRTEKLETAQVKQKEITAAIEAEKVRVADVINQRFDEVKIEVDTNMETVRKTLSGELTVAYPTDISEAPPGYIEAIDWAIEEFYADGNEEARQIALAEVSGTVDGIPESVLGTDLDTDSAIDSAFGNDYDIGNAQDVVAEPPTGSMVATVEGDLYHLYMTYLLGPIYPAELIVSKGIDYLVASKSVAKFEKRIDAIVEFYIGIVNTGIDDSNLLIELASHEITGIIEDSFLEDADKAELEGQIQGPLTELSEEVEAEATGLKEDIVTEKEEKTEAIDEYIARIKANPLKQLAMDLLKKLGTGLEVLLKLFFEIAGITLTDEDFGRLAAVVTNFLDDPIRFITTFVEVVGESFLELFTDLGENLENIIKSALNLEDFAIPDGSAESWVTLFLNLAGEESLEGMMTSRLPLNVELPGGLSINILDAIGGLKSGGLDGMWGVLKGQLTDFPIVGEFVSSQGQDGDQTASDATPQSDDDILKEFGDYSLDDLLAKIVELGADEGFSPAQMDDAAVIFDKISGGDVNYEEILQYFAADMDIDFSNPHKWLWEQMIEWVQNDLISVLPTVLIQFAGGGIGKIAVAVYDAFNWVRDNMSAIGEIATEIFGAIEHISLGNKESAKPLVVNAFTGLIGKIISFVSEVGLGIKISGKIGKIIDKVADKFQNAVDKIMTRIQEAIEKFLKSIQKAMGKKKSSRPKKEGDDEDTGSQGPLIMPRGWDHAELKKQIGFLETGIRGMTSDIPDFPDTPMPEYDRETADVVQNDLKTYYVLKGLENAYELDDDKLESGAMTLDEVTQVASKIRADHNVFKDFRVVKHEDAPGKGFTVEDDKKYWVYEWVASPAKKRAAAEREESNLTFSRLNLDPANNILGVQLFYGDDNVITDVQMAGRPPRLFPSIPNFSASSGDHTTAFIVGQEGIKNRLIGESLSNGSASSEMDGIVKDLTDSFTYKLSENLPARQKLDFDDADDKMKDALAKALATSSTAHTTAEHLQATIRAYLTVKDLLPLATIDTRNQPGSGHGHGEPGAVADLRKFPAIDDQVAIDAIITLFDERSAAVGISATSHLMELLAPGLAGSLESEDEPLTRWETFENLWNQHLDFILQSYPAFNNGGTEHQIISGLRTHFQQDDAAVNPILTQACQLLIKDLGEAANAARLAQEKLADNPMLPDEIRTIRRTWANANEDWSRLNTSGSPIWELISRVIAIYHRFEDVEARQKVVEELNSAAVSDTPGNSLNWKEKVRNLHAFYFNKLVTFLTAGPNVPLNTDAPGNGLAIGDIAIGFKGEAEGIHVGIQLINPSVGSGTSTSTGQPLDEAEVVDNTGGDVDNEDLEVETEELDVDATPGELVKFGRQNLAIQIELHPRTRKIARMITAGRTRSPHGATMGAHAISWISHLNLIRGLIVGKTVLEARDEIRNIQLPFIKALKDAVAESTTDRGDYNAFLGNDVANALNARIATLKDETNPDLGSLQEFIANLLAYANYIPGVTVNSGTLNPGRAEGTHNTNLRNFEDKMWSKFDSTNTLQTITEETMQEKVRAYRNSRPKKITNTDLTKIEAAINGLKDTEDETFITAFMAMIKRTFPWSYFAQTLLISNGSNKKPRSNS